MENNKKHKRKRLYLVNRDFQLRYTGAAVVVGVLSTSLTVVLILYPLYQFEILRIPRFLPTPILIMMAFAALINVSLVGVLGIFITHRIAGPMYSLVRQFRRIEEGFWKGEMRLRDGDDMRYVVRNFNAMISAVTLKTESDLRYMQMITALATDTSISYSEKIEKIIELANELESDLKSRLDSESNPVAVE